LDKPKVLKRLVGIVAGLATALALLAAWADSTPVANVAETRPFALGCAAVALLLVALRWLWDRRVGALRLTAILGATAFAWSFWLLCGGAYRTEQVSFRNGEVRLAGTIFLPPRHGRYPAVVPMHGSGHETRREFFYQAKLFARHGMVALAWDKRGSGASSGEVRAPYEAYAADAEAGARLLAGHPEVDPARLGLYGVSEGGWVAVIAAPRIRPAFLIVVSATPMTPAEQVLYQTGEDVRRRGFGPAAVRDALSLQRRVLDYERSGVAGAGLDLELQAAAKHPWFGAAKLPDRLWPPTEDVWWRSVMDFDPLPGWRRVTCPVLALSGGRDDRSDARASLAGIAAAVREGSRTPVTTVLFPRGDHSLLEWPLGDHVPPPRWTAGYARTLVCWTRLQTGQPEEPFCAGWTPPAAR
jgi:uncharacterized protein